MAAQILNVLRSINDPLRSPKAAERWIASAPWGDTAEIRGRVLDLVTKFPVAGREVGPGRVESLLKVDARLEPVMAELTRHYTASYQKGTDVEVRAWHLVFDLVKAFAAAYQAALNAGYPKGEDKRWRAVLPWVLVRLAHYKGLDGKFRLFRFSHWTPSQWREFHELYEFSRIRGWHREQLVFGAGAFSRPGICVEQEYLKTLLLMRLDSGNFTADQVEWVSQQLDDWAPSLVLASPPVTNASFFVDLAGMQGLVRQDRQHTGGRMLYLDATPVYSRVVERMRWLPEKDGQPLKPGELPAREQRLLLVRLAALYGPDTLAITNRAARQESDSEVRVVFGVRAICSAISENDVPPDGAQPGGSAIDSVTLIAATAADGGLQAHEIMGSMWKMTDTSATGCRLSAQARDGMVRLGELLAIKEGDNWSLAVVRRMQRDDVEGLTLGVEIIAARFVRVVLRNWSASGGGTANDRPYFALYLPTSASNRRAQQRSLIGQEERLVTGAMVELHTSDARYLVRFAQALERQSGWSWTLFNAVRKLAP